MKLVRDKIPEIIEATNKKPITHIASEEEYWKELEFKLKEEVEEFIEDNNKEELADILEVINSICKFKNFDINEIELIRKKKCEERGSFDKRIILDKIE